MRIVAGLLLSAFLALPAIAAQDGTITFDLPNTGGAPSGFRLYRDGAVVATITSGQTVTALAPIDVGTFVIGVEAFNATGPATRVNKTVTLGAVLQVPGPVRNVQIRFACAERTPATCTVTITDAP